MNTVFNKIEYVVSCAGTSNAHLTNYTPLKHTKDFATPNADYITKVPFMFFHS